MSHNLLIKVGWLGSGRQEMAYDSPKSLIGDLPPDRLGAIRDMENS